MTVLCALLLASAEALTVSHGGEVVTVTAAHVQPSGAVARARGDRIEIPLAAGKLTAATLPVEADADVRRIELMGGSEPRLSIQWKHSRHTTELTAAATRVEAIEGGLQVRIPRDPRHVEAAPATAPATP